MKKPVEKPLVTVNKRVKLMWKRKYHMEIRRFNYFSPAFINPDFFQDSLTVRAGAVTAGIIVDFDVPTVSTLA